MPLLVQCPHCPNKVKVPPTWVRATCPQCCTTFDASDLREAAAAASAAPVESTNASPTAPKSDPRITAGKPAPASNVRRPAPRPSTAEEDAESEFPHLNSWGVCAVAAAAVGLGAAPTVGSRPLTIALAILAMALALTGYLVASPERRSKDVKWLCGGGALGAVALLITLCMPGLLNNFWAMDFAVPEPDPQQQLVVPRLAPLSAGQPLKAEDWVDPEKDLIRQHEMVVRVDSAYVGELADKGSSSYFLIQMRLANSGRGAVLNFEGFGRDKHTPILKDRSGRSYPFVEARPRKYNAGGPIEFEAGQLRTGEFRGIMDLQLVFDAPPRGSGPLQLELPAAAWDRQGTCRFRVPESFRFSYEPVSQ